jgi:1,2-phenylacetyl-CoA epoxidase catalytic subunit
VAVTGATSPQPARDPARELAGSLSVEANARRVRRYRYAEERLLRMMAGWIALTPELPAKLLLGRQVWDCAQHADLWGKRLPELRAPGQVSESPGESFAHLLDAIESRDTWDETIERLTGVYRIVKPHLVDVYAAHLAVANAVYEPPTRRILERCLADERRHLADGESVLGGLVRTEADRLRVSRWERELQVRLVESGGIAGPGA